MRYAHQREVSNRLRNERLYRKEAREPFNDTQLTGGLGFHFDPPIDWDDNG